LAPDRNRVIRSWLTAWSSRWDQPVAVVMANARIRESPYNANSGWFMTLISGNQMING
jgi:hypothetical protein